MTEILVGKQALVTGAAGRIGQAVAKELLQQGANIVALDAAGDFAQWRALRSKHTK